jgi:uncharacterized protein YndB with AHSA1/START domain
MTKRSVKHATIVLERRYAASPARVFAAWADPASRLRWGPPSDTAAIAFLETDFRVGGRDVSKCGSKGSLVFHVDTRYEDIVLEQRIVMVETVSTAEARLASSLITVELKAEGAMTRLVLTDQIAAFDDSDMIADSKAGWSASLDNLTKELNR